MEMGEKTYMIRLRHELKEWILLPLQKSVNLVVGRILQILGLVLLGQSMLDPLLTSALLGGNVEKDGPLVDVIRRWSAKGQCQAAAIRLETVTDIVNSPHRFLVDHSILRPNKQIASHPLEKGSHPTCSRPGQASDELESDGIGETVCRVKPTNGVSNQAITTNHVQSLSPGEAALVILVIF